MNIITDSPPFSRNGIKHALFELRFPIITELREPKAPSEFLKIFRKDYPNYEQRYSTTPFQEPAEKKIDHVFQSRDKDWSVVLSSTQLLFDSLKYISYENFFSRVDKTINNVLPLLDTDFFTRAGFRFINELPAERDEAVGWLNDDIIGCLRTNQFGTPDKAWFELLGKHEEYGFIVRYGYPSEQSKLIIDIDVSCNIIEVDNLNSACRNLHDICYTLFSMCIGQKALEFFTK